MKKGIHWDSVVEIFRAMADPSRLKVLIFVLETPGNVTEIVKGLGMKQSLVSHHLGILRECGLVRAQRKGPFVLYEVCGAEVRRLLDLANSLVIERGRGCFETEGPGFMNLNDRKGGKNE